MNLWLVAKSERKFNMEKILVLLRHGESVWNKENLFTGWTDVDLSETGKKEAAQAGVELKKRGYEFDICFTSYLKRAIHTLNLCLESLDEEYLPVIKAWELNERHYGALQGLNKAETAEKYGEAQVKVWRRSYDVQPPKLEPTDDRNPAKQRAYAHVAPEHLPLTESLKDTVARAVPYYENVIKPELEKGKTVLVTAHGNSLRALYKHLKNLTDEEIINVNIPTGVPLVFHFDDNFNIVKEEYIGDQEAIAAKMQSVANQGKAKK